MVQNWTVMVGQLDRYSLNYMLKMGEIFFFGRVNEFS